MGVRRAGGRMAPDPGGKPAPAALPRAASACHWRPISGVPHAPFAWPRPAKRGIASATGNALRLALRMGCASCVAARPVGNRARLEAIAVADADVVEGFVVLGEIAVRGVLEIDGQALVRVPAVAEFEGDVEQHARAERLAVGVGGLEIAIVNGGAKAQANEDAVVRLDFPARIEIGLARVAAGIDGSADRGAGGAAGDG